jgi:Flp pilus assembly protein TadD
VNARVPAAGQFADARLRPASGYAADRAGERMVRPRQWHAVAVLVITIGITLLYRPTLGYQFVFDDFHLVVANPEIRLAPSEWWRYFVPGEGGYRPVRNLSYAIDYRIGGLDPRTFRRTNILLHVGGALAAFGLATALGLNWVGAGVTAAFFAVHPIQIESVTYVSGRRDVLCGALFLAGVLCYVRFRQSGRYLWLAWASVASLAALLAKEMAVSLPLVYLLYEWCFGCGHRRRRTLAILTVLLGAVAAMLVLFYGGLILRHARDIPWHGGSIERNFAAVARVWVHYLGQLVYPKTLVADYSGRYFPIPRGMLDWPVLFSLAGIAAWIAIGIRLRQRQPVVSFAALWLPITLLPVSQVIPHGELLADHYLYIPAFGICLLAGVVSAALFAYGTAGRLVALTIITAALSGLAWRTVVRNRDWRDSIEFYTALVEQNPYSPRVYLGLGNEYVKARQPRLAAHVFAKGLQLAPDSPWLHLNRGAALQQIDEFAAAEREYERAGELGLNTRTLWTNRSVLYASTGRYREARSALRHARNLPGGRADPSVYINTALLLRVEQKYDRALRLLRRAARLSPSNPAIQEEIQRTERLRRQSVGQRSDGLRRAPSIARVRESVLTVRNGYC